MCPICRCRELGRFVYVRCLRDFFFFFFFFFFFAVVILATVETHWLFSEEFDNLNNWMSNGSMINFANIGNCPVNASDRCLSFNNTRNCGLVYNRMFQSPTGRFKLDLTIFHGSVCSTINTCGDMVHAWQIDAQSCNVSSPPFELASSSQSRCPAASSCYPASYGGTFGRSSSGHFSTESFQFVTNTTNVRMGITQYLGTSGAFYLSRMVLARERVMTPRPVPTLPSPTPSAPTPPGAPSPVPLTAPQPTPPVTASPPTPSTTTTTTTITTVTTMTPQPTTTTTTTTTVTKTTSIETTTPASSTTVCKPIDCEWAAWSSWFCPVTCGGGTATRSRSIHVESSCGGESCKGQDVETMDQCAPLPCPVDCEVSQWSDWSMCGASCGPKALESRTRKVEKPAANGGMPCPASLNDSRACGPACCPENCIVSNWSGWSACSVTCGRGLLTRTRSVSRPAQCDGTCLDDLSESTQCNAPSQCTLPAVDCDISAWSAWSKCSASCGAATKTRARVVRTEAANGGQPCPIDLSEVDLCNSPSCTTTTMATTTTTTAPPTQTSVGANGEVRVIASTDLAIAGGRNESLSVVIGGVGIRVTANPNNAMLQDLPGAGLGVYSSAHGDDGKSGTMRLRAGLEVVFRFKVPVAIKRILLGAWESGDRGMLVCSEPGKKRQIASTTDLALRNADTSFEAETADGFTRYVVQALNNSDFQHSGIRLCRRRAPHQVDRERQRRRCCRRRRH
jgi:hypothetical protein